MKKIKRIFVCVMSLILFISNFSYAGELKKEPIINKLPDYVRKAKTGEYLDVIINLKDQTDTSAIKTKEENKLVCDDETKTKIIRKEIVKKLEQNAKSSQEDVIETIEDGKRLGEVKNFKSYYIINSIHLVAKKEFIEKVAKFDEVYEIIENKTIKEKKEEPVKKQELRAFSTRSVQKHIPWNLKAINAIEAQDYVKEKEGAVVAIIDSGVDYNHPAIRDNYRGNNPTLRAYSWYDATKNKFGDQTFPDDAGSHGTHVCGTILGKNTKTDSYMGVAPDAKWIAVKIFNERGETTTDYIIRACEWIMAPYGSDGVKRPDLAPKVINNSWGGGKEDHNNFYKIILKRWRDAGIIPIYAAGNARQAKQGGDGSVGIPGSYPEAYTVGALDLNDELIDFSYRGPSIYTDKWKPDISAPGVNILSSIPGQRYSVYSGTSMAAPHVTGVVALMLQANPNLNANQIEDILDKTATPLTDDNFISSPNHGYGYGKVNAYNAVRLAEKQKKDTAIDDKEMGFLEGNVYTSASDDIKPEISGIANNFIVNTFDSFFEAKVKDNSGVKRVSLNLDDHIYDMALIKGNYINGIYRVKISPNLIKSKKLKYFIEAEDINGNITRADEKNLYIKSALKTGYKQDFENDFSGFKYGSCDQINDSAIMTDPTTSRYKLKFDKDVNLWQWGEPTYGPENKSGNKVLGTVLDGTYQKIKRNSSIIMPLVDLSDEREDVRLKLDHWYDLTGGDKYANFYIDTAEILIAEVGDEKSEEDLTYIPIKQFKKSSKGWQHEDISLNDYLGKKISIMFKLEEGSLALRKKSAGWYIDNISIAREGQALESIIVEPGENINSVENYEKGSKIPLSAKIKVMETGIEVKSQEGSGRYFIKHPAGHYKLLVEKEGFLPQEKDVIIEAGAKNHLEDIYLKKDLGNKLEIEILDDFDLPTFARVQIYKKDDIKELYSKEGSKIEFSNLNIGKYKLLVSGDGIQTRELEIDLKSDQKIQVRTKKVEYLQNKSWGYEGELADNLTCEDDANRLFAFGIKNEKTLELDELEIYLTRSKEQENIKGQKYKVYIFEGNNDDGLPGKILYSTEKECEKDGWNKIKIPKIQVRGDFYLAYKKDEGYFGLGLDSNKPFDNSYVLYKGAWNPSSTLGMYMIRAIGKEINPQKANGHKLYFKSNDINRQEKVEEIEDLAAYKLPELDFEPEIGKVFAGWIIEGKEYQPGDIIYPSSDMEILAKWKEKDAESINPNTNQSLKPEVPEYLSKIEEKTIPIYFGVISSSQSENKKEIEKKEEPQKDYENHWAKEAIDFCLKKGYFKDIADNSSFNPEKAATRAEFITVLARYAGVYNKTNKAGFEDVSSDKYYSPFISWAKENKIILGRGNGKFAPDDTISRAEMATIIHRMAKVLKLDKFTKNMNMEFKDADEIPDWAIDQVKDLVNLGIINGNSDNTFNPKGNFKRAELAQIIYNFSKNK